MELPAVLRGPRTFCAGPGARGEVRGEVAGGEVLWVEATVREFSLGWVEFGDIGVATLPVGRNKRRSLPSDVPEEQYGGEKTDTGFIYTLHIQSA